MAFGFVPGIISFGREIPTPSGYIREVGIPINTASSTTLTDYPLYIRLQSSSFIPVGSGGKIKSSDGNDIMFYADSGLNTLLQWDFTYWDKVNGIIVVWVKIPSLSNVNITTIYINYGNTKINLNTYYGDRKSVWSGYNVVSHLSDKRTFYNSVNDMELDHYGSGMQSTTLGELNYGLLMGSTDLNYIDTNYKPINSFTYSFFFIVPTKINGMEVVGNYSNDTDTGTGISLFNDGDTSLFYYADNKFAKKSNSQYLSSPNFVTIEYDNDTSVMSYYKDGVIDSTLTSATVDGTNNFLIGMFNNTNLNFKGAISDFKIHGGLRSEDDIATEYQFIKTLYRGYSLGGEVLYITGYKHYVQLTYVNPTTATNYPIYINVMFNDLKTASNGGYVMNPNGYDIMFFADSGLTQPLQYEIESYSGTVGNVVAHVNIPSLVTGVSSVIYMAFGFKNINEKPNLPTKTWNNSYTAVYNFANNHNSTTDTADSTVYGFNLTPSSATHGIFLNDDAAAYIDTPIYVNSPVLTANNDMTVYGWFNFNNVTDPYQTLFYVGDISVPNGFGLVVNASNDGDGTLYFVADGMYYNMEYQVSTGGFTPYYLVISDNSATIYQGGLNIIATTNFIKLTQPTNITRIGYSNFNGQNYYLAGSINRLRFVNRAMSDLELANEWLAQNLSGSSVHTSTGITGGYSFFFDPGNTNSYNDPDTHISDLSIYGTTGFTVNTPTYSTSGGGSLAFDATNYGYFQDTTDSFDLSGSDGYTIESWVNFDTFTSHNNNGQTPISKGIYGESWDWGINVVNSTTITFNIRGTAKKYTVSLATPLQTNTWYHIVVVGNNLNVSNIYINGELVGGYNDIYLFNIVTTYSNYIEIGGYGWKPNGGAPESTSFGDPTSYGKLLGKLGVCRVYKRMLEDDDILINYAYDYARYS